MSNNSDISNESKDIGGDIEIQDDQVNHFFFMDSDEEKKTYGTSSNANLAMSGNILKDAAQQKAAKLKQIVDFKLRVLDFIEIYIKEMKKDIHYGKPRKLDSIKIIKGLIKSLQIAHQDKNTQLFDRIKSVLGIIAKGSFKKDSDAQKNNHALGAEEQQQQNKDRKILMTEIISLVLKPTKDQKMHQAYIDCFITLTKQFCEFQDKEMTKYVSFCYKELLKKFLGGRGASAHSLNQQFFYRIFEECDSSLGKSLLKPLLRYILPSIKQKQQNEDDISKLAESELSLQDEKVDSSKNEGSRSNHQRVLAIEILLSMVKAAQKNASLLKGLAENLDLITQILCTLLKSSNSWESKKVKKTMLSLNIFTKLCKTIVLSKNLDKNVFVSSIQKNGKTLIDLIEIECEKDKTMSNLKGKVKEIQALIQSL